MFFSIVILLHATIVPIAAKTSLLLFVGTTCYTVLSLLTAMTKAITQWNTDRRLFMNDGITITRKYCSVCAFLFLCPIVVVVLCE